LQYGCSLVLVLEQGGEDGVVSGLGRVPDGPVESELVRVRVSGGEHERESAVEIVTVHFIYEERGRARRARRRRGERK
jgi:hypothetical protein